MKSELKRLAIQRADAQSRAEGANLTDVLAAARCPECGDRIILPNSGIIKAMGGDKSTSDPHVWCADHGHWVGYLSETVKAANDKLRGCPIKEG
jgi:hypothetical protein